jgi:hypothetical protein
MYVSLFDYHVTPSGFAIRLLKVVPLYRLRHRHIVNVRIVKGWFGAFRFGAHVALGNRLRWTWVLVEKRRWPRASLL